MIGYIFDEQRSSVSAAGAFVPQATDAVLYFARQRPTIVKRMR